MTADPGASFIAAVFSRLSRDERLRVRVEGRIYEDPPEDAAYPFVHLFSTDVSPWHAGALAGAELFQEIHIWSRPARGRGSTEVRELAQLVVAALDLSRLSAQGHVVQHLEHRQTRYRLEPDGITWRAFLQFDAVTSRN